MTKTRPNRPPAHGSRRALAGMVLVCVLLSALAGYQSFMLLTQARGARLAAAEHVIVKTTAPLIRQDRVSPALVRAASNVLASARLGMNYVTLRNRAGETLVSQGRFEDVLGRLPAAPAWRGLLYRLLSAEDTRVLTRAGQPVGSMHYGAGWLGIVAAAGVTAWAWIALLLAAGIAACVFVVRFMRTPTAAVEPPQASPALGPRFPKPTPRVPKKAPSLFRSQRSSRDAEGYALIALAASAPPSAAAHDASVSSAPVSPAPEQPKPQAEPLAAQPEAREASVPEPPAAPAPAAVSPEPAPKPPAVPPPAATSPQLAPEPATQPVGASEPELHAPQLDAKPTLGDDTLDLCFYPIWRGADRRALAGASAALTWRSGEGELVDPASLTRLAERDGVLRAFTHWIARRFSVLHSNWRNLELNTVPIVLPIPTAMLAFADAETVWQDAIARTDRDPDDLILKLTRQSAARRPGALPIRRALAANDAPETRAGGDVLCIKPEDVSGGERDQWAARLDEPGPPILFGPVAEPEQWRDTLDHERVAWFSEERSGLCSSREFARLLARRKCHAL